MRKKPAHQQLCRLYEHARRLAIHEIGVDNLAAMGRKDARAAVEEHAAATIEAFAVSLDRSIQEVRG
jgi:hypothetical protein